MTLIKCKKCKKEISDAAKVCVHCGEPNEPTIICPECKKENNLSDKICKKCGYPLQKESSFETGARKACKSIASAFNVIADEFDKIVTKK